MTFTYVRSEKGLDNGRPRYILQNEDPNIHAGYVAKSIIAECGNDKM